MRFLRTALADMSLTTFQPYPSLFSAHVSFFPLFCSENHRSRLSELAVDGEDWYLGADGLDWWGNRTMGAFIQL